MNCGIQAEYDSLSGVLKDCCKLNDGRPSDEYWKQWKLGEVLN